MATAQLVTDSRGTHPYALLAPRPPCLPAPPRPPQSRPSRPRVALLSPRRQRRGTIDHWNSAQTAIQTLTRPRRSHAFSMPGFGVWSPQYAQSTGGKGPGRARRTYSKTATVGISVQIAVTKKVAPGGRARWRTRRLSFHVHSANAKGARNGHKSELREECYYLQHERQDRSQRHRVVDGKDGPTTAPRPAPAADAAAADAASV